MPDARSVSTVLMILHFDLEILLVGMPDADVFLLFFCYYIFDLETLLVGMPDARFASTCMMILLVRLKIFNTQML